MLLKPTTILFVTCLGLSFVCQSKSFPSESGRFIRSPSAAIDALNDASTQIGDFVSKGTKVPKKAIEQVTKFITVLTDGITKIDNEIKALQKLTATNNLESHNLNHAYYHEYLPIKKNLRESRLKLTRLAKKTVNMSKKIKGFYDNTNIGDAVAIKAQMHTLKKFLKESMPILLESEAEYKSAIDKLETFAPKFFDFNQEVKKMLDQGDALWYKWTSEVRAGVYAGAGTGTTICIIVDVAGAAGLCSAIYNSIAWPAAVGGVEGAIAAYTSQLKNVKLAGDEINLRMTGLDTSMKETIAFLETEVKIIIEWQEDVENVQDTVSQFNAQQLSELKDVFIDGIDDLQASAQAFLDRPDNVFGS